MEAHQQAKPFESMIMLGLFLLKCTFFKTRSHIFWLNLVFLQIEFISSWLTILVS